MRFGKQLRRNPLIFGSKFAAVAVAVFLMWKPVFARVAQQRTNGKCALQNQQQHRRGYLSVVQRCATACSFRPGKNGDRTRVFSCNVRGGAATSTCSLVAKYGDDDCGLHCCSNTNNNNNVRKLSTHAATDTTTTTTAYKYKYRVYLAVGSNLGDRFANIRKALQLLLRNDHDEDRALAPTPLLRLVRTSFLHETAPMYVTDQPAFLNGAVAMETNLSPLELLRRIKDAEARLGRDLFTATRNGPRPVDLDILSYETIITAVGNVDDDDDDDEMLVMDTPELTVPHPRIQERDFVLIPLIEVAGRDMSLPGINGTLGDALTRLRSTTTTTLTQEEAQPSAVRVVPLPRARMLYFNETIIMGILNATPDSFSDGGMWTTSVDVAVQRALAMERQGAGIIDIGGESTRPGALEIDIAEELRRTIPIIQGIRKESSVPISIDTRHSVVAKAAVEAGADIVNDVSGGTFDEAMLRTVGELGVPMIIMHMRGTPETMQSLTAYDDVVSDVAETLLRQSILAAEEHAVHRWTQIVDPGIGFAKDLRGNLLLLKHVARIRSTVGGLPILIGTSRKGFIGKISGAAQAEDRDAGTIASCVAALCLEDQPPGGADNHQRCSILRVHNVAECKQAARVMDAIRGVR